MAHFKSQHKWAILNSYSNFTWLCYSLFWPISKSLYDILSADISTMSETSWPDVMECHEMSKCVLKCLLRCRQEKWKKNKALQTRTNPLLQIHSGDSRLAIYLTMPGLWLILMTHTVRWWLISVRSLTRVHHTKPYDYISSMYFLFLCIRQCVGWPPYSTHAVW